MPQAEIQLFDPNDPKVKDLEEWNCSVHEKSIYEEVKAFYLFSRKSLKPFQPFQEAPKKRLRRMFSLRKKNKPEELKVLTKMNSVVRKKSGPVRTINASEYSDKYYDDNVNLECFKTWLLSIFVKIFD